MSGMKPKASMDHSPSWPLARRDDGWNGRENELAKRAPTNLASEKNLRQTALQACRLDNYRNHVGEY